MPILVSLKKELLSQNPEVRLAASAKLSRMGGKKALDILIPMLKNKRPEVRNAAGLALRKIADKRAVGPLMRAIKNLANRHHNGTLVYALETHDCSRLFLPMVQLALYGDYEVQSHALMILKKQKFSTSLKEIQEARRHIEKYQKKNKKCENSEILIEELSRYILKVERQIRVSPES